MACAPPSYEDAVSGGDWLDLVAPYVSAADYARLCRVARRFYDRFAPLLWNDPLQTVRMLGLHRNDDFDWLVFFVTRHAKTVRASCRDLVMSLDFRGFDAVEAASVAGADGHSFSQLLRCLRPLFPSARCLLLGGSAAYDPADLGHPRTPDGMAEDGSVPLPLVLDMAHCGLPLPNRFFHAPYWRQLVYLDMSAIPGSLEGLAKTGTFRHGALPNLRVLKLRRRGLDDASLAPLAAYAKDRVWSLDLAGNRLTDGGVCRLLAPCFGGGNDLTVDGGRFAVEGRLAAPACSPPPEAHAGAAWRGRLAYIAESAAGASFSHPDRYLADAPVYEAGQTPRLAGNEGLLSDRADDVKLALAGGFGRPAPGWHGVRDADLCRAPASLSHLHLIGNRDFTVDGVEALFRCARGHIRHFDCAVPGIGIAAGGGGRGAPRGRLAGVVGRSHLFRPVLASNLQSLRIHHSLVTHIPTFEAAAPSSMGARDALAYAETVLRERAELAYPQAFVPDMNPRLQALTLTCLPRVSTGPLIDKLTQFLAAAAEQDTAIRSVAASQSRRGPALLRGLRRIRLEFEPCPPDDDDIGGDGDLDRLDAQALLSSGPADFSFFSGAGGTVSTSPSPSSNSTAAVSPGGIGQAQGSESGGGHRATTSADWPASAAAAAGAATAATCQSARFAHYPLPGALDAASAFVWDTIALDDGCATTGTRRVPVWVGSGCRGAHRAANAYMANLATPALRARVRPASPDHTKAGVPPGVLVYTAAWDAILWSGTAAMPGGAAAAAATATSTTASLRRRPMRDVVEAIRRFRAETKAGRAPGQSQRRPACGHWTGTLEVLLAP